MDCSTPWIVKANGKKLGPYDLVSKFICEDEGGGEPQGSEPAWLKSAVGAWWEKCPWLEDAGWECVIAIWRLKSVENQADHDDDTWRLHLQAWLVRDALVMKLEGN